MTFADLYDAELDGADLSAANLQGARLQGDNLRGATLEGADLTDANLRLADLFEVRYDNANLTHSDFREARNLSIEKLKAARHWDRAFYDKETLKALRLPVNHNTFIAKQQKKEKELPGEPKSR